MTNPDKTRRDGRTDKSVSLTRTIKSSVLLLNGDYIALKGFPHYVWFNHYHSIPFDKVYYFNLAEIGGRWFLVDYLEPGLDRVKGNQDCVIGTG